MEALVRAVLFRARGLRADRLDPELEPPDAELGEPAQASGSGERRPVVAQDRARQAELAEGTLEDRPGAPTVGAAEAIERQAHPTRVIEHGQRIAPPAVLRRELALEVSRPEVVRLLRGDLRRTRMRLAARSSPVLGHQTFASKQLAHAARGRPGRTRMPSFEPRQDLPRPPARVLAPHLEQRFPGGFAHAPLGAVRRAAAIGQSRHAFRFEAGRPPVARLAAHVVALAELFHRIQARSRVLHEPDPLFHGRRRSPGHGSSEEPEP